MKLNEKMRLSMQAKRTKTIGLVTFATALAGTLTLAVPGESAPSASEPTTAGSMPGFRRLNETQYKRSIAQIFGDDITIPGRFSPPLREEGLLSIGNNNVTVTASGIEQYELRAREISAQVFNAEHRQDFLTCDGPTASFDEACAKTFFQHYGRLLYRRPLENSEVQATLDISRAAFAQSGNFYDAMALGLSRLLVSPKFIFRVEGSETDPRDSAVRQLDAYSFATRISFLLWDAPPDAELLDAAARGDLENDRKLAKQIDRLVASPRFEDGVRAFFSDMFGYEQFEGLTKDQAIYPKFNAELAEDAREQTLLTVIDHLISQNGDYRDLFTTKKTFINRNLGALYKVPVEVDAMEGWAPFRFSENDPRAGILTLAGFLMLDPTHEGRSSPTNRGKSVREFLLCQPVPQPPPNVDFAVVQDTGNPEHRTARQRLTIHQENPACAGCHALTDPIGLSMENYDAIGQYRTHENNALIDATGTFEGKSYTGLEGLSQIMRESEEIPRCLVQRTYEYGTGRAASADDEAWLGYANTSFAKSKYRFPGLMRMIALSDAFRKVATPTTNTNIAAR